MESKYNNSHVCPICLTLLTSSMKLTVLTRFMAMSLFKVMVIQAMKKVDFHQRTMIWTILGQIKEAMMKVNQKNKILLRIVHQTQMGKVMLSQFFVTY